MEGASFDPGHNALFTVGESNQFRYYDLANGDLRYSQIISNGANYVHAKRSFYHVGWTNETQTFFHRFTLAPGSPDPAITEEIQDQVVLAGGTASFNVGLRGEKPLFYQWFFESKPLQGRTNASLSITNVQKADQGKYFLVVSNSFNATTSAIAQLTTLLPPVITQQPLGTIGQAGGETSFTVEATGTAPFSYQWTFEGVSISAATNATFLLANLQPVHEGYYRVSVSNAYGVAVSAPAVLRISPSLPRIATNPSDLTLDAGENATLTVAALGSQPMNFQWVHDGGILSANSPSLTISNVQASNAGEYRVIITNALGVSTSSVATITVLPSLPSIKSQPLGGTVVAGTSNFVLNAVARGSEPITYQWLQNGTIVPDGNKSTLVLSNLSIAQSGQYALVAANGYGSVTRPLCNCRGLRSAFIDYRLEQLGR